MKQAPRPAPRPRLRLVGLVAPAAAALALSIAGAAAGVNGSARDYREDPANVAVPQALLKGFDFESLGFSRGGRVTAVAGVVGQPLVYYFGSTGGGVWKTIDAGNNWTNVTDGYLGVGSIGAVTVAPSDPNVIYVGTGSACPRGNISNGDGLYRSTDAGKTWKHVGLPQSGQVGRIQVHPQDPDRAWVAALGNVFGPNDERGIFRTTDGGATWKKVLYVDDRTGFVDIALDAKNPRILYAAAWRAERKPWTLISGSEDGGVWKTTDGGDTWTKLEKGLPKGYLGKIGVTVSPANPNRVWALVEAEGDDGGVYRSDDAGESFTRLTGEAKLRQRPWYYHHIYADPKDANTVYVLNVGFFRSVDGGRTFAEGIRVPHGDNHDLWINPDDPLNMVQGNDGGANVTFDGGKSWSWQMNQPTAEIYRLVVDQQWPYRVYGSQQDNSTISVPSQGFVAWNRMPPDWNDVGGCESGHIAVDPRDADIVYAGCYGGSITRTDLETGDQREVITYPQLQLGQAPRDLEFRFQWNAPIRLSPHDPDVLYHTSQVVHRSTDGGQTWQVISPDLTTDNEEQQDFSGGPVTRDNTGTEVYNTIFAFEESPHRKGELWAGSDDGRLHVSRDAGSNWSEVTPKDMPRGGTVNSIDVSAHDPDRVHIAVYRYREDDFKPYLFRTNDGGKSWQLLTNGRNGIPDTNFTRVVREDPVRKGLLFAGTEYGLYVSFDDGRRWQRFGDDEKLGDDLPATPVTDLAIHRDDLVISTQGRGFWILRHIAALRQVDGVGDSRITLFAPGKAYRGGGPARVFFHVAELPKEAVKLEVLEGERVVRSVEWKPDAKPEAGSGGGGGDEDDDFPGFGGGGDTLKVEQGLNSWTWNLRGKAPEAPKGVIHWGGTPGIAVLPGQYTVRLTSSDFTQSQPLAVEAWPALASTVEDLKQQHEVGTRIGARLEQAYDAITSIRELKAQAKGVAERAKKVGIEDEALQEQAKSLDEKLTKIEEQLTQVKSKSGQDPLNFPPMLDNQYVEVYANVVASNHRPTAGALKRIADLDPKLDALLADLEQVVDVDVAAFNAKVEELNVPALAVPVEEEEDEASDSGN